MYRCGLLWRASNARRIGAFASLALAVPARWAVHRRAGGRPSSTTHCRAHSRDVPMAACGLRLYWQTVPRSRSCSVRGAWGVGRRESVCHASSLWFGGQRVGQQVARPCQCSARAHARCGLAPGGYLFSSGHVGQGLVSFGQEPLRARTAEEHGAGQQGSGVPSRRHRGGAAGVPASRPGDVCGLLGQWPAARLASPACGRGRGDAATRGAGQHLR